MSSATIWRRVTKDVPCPICGHAGYCTMAQDHGESPVIVKCCRVESGKYIKSKNGSCEGWLHVLKERTPMPPIPSPSEPIDFRGEAVQAFLAKAAKEKRIELADQLGVLEGALHDLGVGWLFSGKSGYAWSCPEKDGNGTVCGISLRYPDGRKMVLKGSKRGLTYVKSWLFKLPLYVVEGMSDVAAALSMNLSVIGRPSNAGGSEQIVQLVKSSGYRGPIVIMGESDMKPHDALSVEVQSRHAENCPGCAACFPGKFGMTQIAKNLRYRIDNKIFCSLPPDGAKDVREWLHITRGDDRIEESLILGEKWTACIREMVAK